MEEYEIKIPNRNIDTHLQEYEVTGAKRAFFVRQEAGSISVFVDTVELLWL